MAIAVLRPHDCLQRRLTNDAFSLKSSRRNPNPNQTRRRKRSPVAAHQNFQENRDRSSCCGDQPVVVKGPGANLVMGQVKILKRGEKLTSQDERPKPKGEEEGFDFALGSTNRMGPEPDTVNKQIRVLDLKVLMFAGSTFSGSPPPSSVPVPGFLKKSHSAAILRSDSV